MHNGDGGAIRIGVGGWIYEPWRGTFYPAKHPAKRELEYASRRLSSIEINGTFYRTQTPASFAKWRDETPDDFVFALKGPRYATHRTRLADANESIERFFDSGVLELGDKLGPVNWQFPTSRKFDASEFEAFLQLLPTSIDGRPLRHAIEVRHDSFRTGEFVALARAHGVAIVVAGDSEHPQIADPTAPFVYARIMGTQESEPAGYSASALDRWTARIKAWASGAIPEGLDVVDPPPAVRAQPGAAAPRDVYLYVISGHKARNPAAALALIERLG
ncbi:MAG: DUF72 domain-containing protein [Burkholderiaceae bacterium]|jgi:uncharacterized protein YecE (DUF72 family)|nr:DUF72 domain-containing protein [Burkholderiaceae bacterium]